MCGSIFGTGAGGLEVGDVEDVEGFYEGLDVCSWRDVLDESDDLFLRDKETKSLVL